MHRTLPPYLTPLGSFILKCWFDIAGGGIDNGVGRLIMGFACGFNDSKSLMLGMPFEGNVNKKMKKKEEKEMTES